MTSVTKLVSAVLRHKNSMSHSALLNSGDQITDTLIQRCYLRDVGIRNIDSQLFVQSKHEVQKNPLSRDRLIAWISLNPEFHCFCILPMMSSYHYVCYISARNAPLGREQKAFGFPNTEGSYFQICEDSLRVLPELINPIRIPDERDVFGGIGIAVLYNKGLSTLTRL